MAGFEEEVVRAYFEANGFLVRSAGLPPEAGKKRSGPLRTLAVFNPEAAENAPDAGFRLYTSDVSRIRAGLVSVLGWETAGFTANLIGSDAALLRFLKTEATDKRLSSGFSPATSLPEARMGDCLHLLVVPALPRADSKLKESLEALREAGAQGVFTLRSMLENLLRRAEPGRDYAALPAMQALRILKAYGLAAEPQLELFPE